MLLFHYFLKAKLMFFGISTALWYIAITSIQFCKIYSLQHFLKFTFIANNLFYFILFTFIPNSIRSSGGSKDQGKSSSFKSGTNALQKPLKLYFTVVGYNSRILKAWQSQSVSQSIRPTISHLYFAFLSHPSHSERGFEQSSSYSSLNYTKLYSDSLSHAPSFPKAKQTFTFSFIIP